MQVGTFAFVSIKSDTIVINKGEFFEKVSEYGICPLQQHKSLDW